MVLKIYHGLIFVARRAYGFADIPWFDFLFSYLVEVMENEVNYVFKQKRCGFYHPHPVT
jgi:hypothetical protein